MQSLDMIFTTRINSRLERRSFGSVASDLVDKPATPETILDHYVAMAEAIDAFEPRVILNGFSFVEAEETGRTEIRVDVTDVKTGQKLSVVRPV